MKKVIALLLITTGIFSTNLRSQTDTTAKSTESNNSEIATSGQKPEKEYPKRNNVIKTKPFRMVFGALSPLSPIPLNLTYERALGKRISLSLNVIYGPTRHLKLIESRINDAISTNADPTKGYGKMSDLETKRMYVSPEFRIYAGKKGAPRGFYFSVEPYYSSLTTTTNVEYGYYMDITTDQGSVSYLYKNDYDLTMNFRNLGLALGIGNQWLIGDRVSLDILWLGFGAGMGNITTKIDGVLINTADIEADIANNYTHQPTHIDNANIPTWETLADGFEESIGPDLKKIPYLGNKISFTGQKDYAAADYNGMLARLRLLNISLGVAF